jgi:hypothetical protein
MSPAERVALLTTLYDLRDQARALGMIATVVEINLYIAELRS